jgi:hypothetical protein
MTTASKLTIQSEILTDDIKRDALREQWQALFSRHQVLLGNACLPSSAWQGSKQSFTRRHYQAELGSEKTMRFLSSAHPTRA